ncbi:hypothetical protein GCM10023321_41510 [Pseudonocardia eucalypti]|uniref:Uncharacterized protein n=1 Tax=Pseudonocardia eucalypti TaxID=648755 RepID=A0ABP9QCY4_9PSEU
MRAGSDSNVCGNELERRCGALECGTCAGTGDCLACEEDEFCDICRDSGECPECGGTGDE